MLLALAAAMAIFFIYVKVTAPAQSAMNGTYYNSCCGDVVLRDGVLLYKGIRHEYDLENMKFGLTAYVQGDFTEQGIAPSSEPTPFIFFTKDGRYAFKAVIHGREYAFLQAGSARR